LEFPVRNKAVKNYRLHNPAGNSCKIRRRKFTREKNYISASVRRLVHIGEHWRAILTSVAIGMGLYDLGKF
jgi:hypothetical protein